MPFFPTFVRIISGKHKGKILSAPKKLPVRPTTDMAKEALFNILENRYFLDNKKVLDLFSGTGNIAFEFASRGCEDVTAIDQNFHCIKFISKENKNKTELEKDLEKDAQLRHAVSLLSGWDVMVSTFKNNQFEKIPPALPLAKINR